MPFSKDMYTLLQQAILHQEPLIEEYLELPPQGTLADRIAIYANGFNSRVNKVLLSDFQLLALLIGYEEFGQLSRQYALSYPLCHYSLDKLGQHFSRYLAEINPYKQQPYLAEIATYLWAESRAFIAADLPSLTITEWQNVSSEQWPDMTFCLHPSCHLLHMHWNSLALMNGLRDKKDPLPKPYLLAHSQAIMIWRYQHQVTHCLLDELETLIIGAIINKASFIDICESLHYQKIAEEEVVTYLIEKLYIWNKKEWFV